MLDFMRGREKAVISPTIQITLDQLIFCGGIALFLAIIYKLSVRPVLAVSLIAAMALFGCLISRIVRNF